MSLTRRVLGALVITLALAGCALGVPPRPTAVSTAQLAAIDQPQFTPEQVQYLAAQAWAAAETANFLHGVQQLVDATPAQLWRIMWCESGRPYALPAYTPKWDAYNQQGSSASGGGQFLDSTWRAWRGDVGATYARAAHAPWFVQLVAANRLYAADGTAPWSSSASCWR